MLVVAIGLIGCGKKEETTALEEKSTIIEETIPAEDESLEEPAATEEVETDPTVDLDLTALSSTMIYSEVFNMMMDPESYEGKSIKMDGNCSIYTDEATGETYYACIVQDATQCCSQGLEFVLDENEYSAEDYPAEGEEIVIKGTFSAYTEGEYMYITIKDSVLE